MFEMYKSGRPDKIFNELTKLYFEIKNEYSENFKNIYNNFAIESIEFGIEKYRYTFGGSFNHRVINIKTKYFNYHIEMGKKSFFAVKYDSVIIYHNRQDNSCDGKFENVESGWRHKLPKNMLEMISQDMIHFKVANENLKEFIKTHASIEEDKLSNEKKILNEVFK